MPIYFSIVSSSIMYICGVDIDTEQIKWFA